jgi:hypothetical protein
VTTEHLRATLEMLIEYDTAMMQTHQELIASRREHSRVAGLLGVSQAEQGEIQLYEKMIRDLENRIAAHRELLSRLDSGVCPYCGRPLVSVGVKAEVH